MFDLKRKAASEGLNRRIHTAVKVTYAAEQRKPRVYESDSRANAMQSGCYQLPTPPPPTNRSSSFIARSKLMMISSLPPYSTSALNSQPILTKAHLSFDGHNIWTSVLTKCVKLSYFIRYSVCPLI